MSKYKTLKPINDEQVKSRGVVSLAIRPNQLQNSSQYGEGGLSARELQRKFDSLAKLAIERCNALVKLLSGSYRPTNADDPESVLEYILAFKGSESEGIHEDMSLKDVLDKILTTNAELKAIDPTSNNADTFTSLNTVLSKMHNAALERFGDIDATIYELRDILNDKASTSLVEQLADELSAKADESYVDEIDAKKIDRADIVSNLFTDDPNKPLSAAQGVALKQLIDNVGSGSGGSGGSASLAWSDTYDPSKPLYAVRIYSIRVYEPDGFQPIETIGSYYNWADIHFLSPVVDADISKTVITSGAWFTYGNNINNQRLWYVRTVRFDNKSFNAISFADNTAYYCEFDNVKSWLQPAEDTTVSTALDELHEYAQGIISGVSD